MVLYSPSTHPLIPTRTHTHTHAYTHAHTQSDSDYFEFPVFQMTKIGAHSDDTGEGWETRVFSVTLDMGEDGYPICSPLCVF